MCTAYNNEDHKWLINPMFIEPFNKQQEKYPCSTAACGDENGTLAPCKDEQGNIIPDQEDRVFPGAIPPGTLRPNPLAGQPSL